MAAKKAKKKTAKKKAIKGKKGNPAKPKKKVVKRKSCNPVKKKVAKKKVTKKKTGQKLDKGTSIYNPEMADRVRVVILEIKPIKDNGTLHYGQIARVMGITQISFSRWRDPESQYYKPDFVKALTAAGEELNELIDLGKIKRAMINRAQPYKRTRTTRELRPVGPAKPDNYEKATLRDYCTVNNIEFDDTDLVVDLKYKIRGFIDENTVEEMIPVKIEEEMMHGDVAAARMCTENIGPKEKRWNSKLNLSVEPESIADIFALLGGKEE